jgi:NAD(P)H-hydrate epimerase
LIKILTAEQTRAADQYTIADEGIDSIELMERASGVFARYVLEKFDSAQSLLILAGKGNNGGDALAVARLLAEQGKLLRVVIPASLEGSSKDFDINLERLRNYNIYLINGFQNIDSKLLKEVDLIIDGVLGSGLDRPLKGIYAETAELLQKSSCPVVSIDIPSGYPSDQQSEGVFFPARHCLSFEKPWLSFLLSADAPAMWTFESIGLSKPFIDSLPGQRFLVERKDIITNPVFSPREAFSDKSDYGYLIIVGGAEGMQGAAYLAGLAALRSGVGRCAVCSPQSQGKVFNPQIPELMHWNLERLEQAMQQPHFFERFQLLIGPGLDQSEAAKSVLQKIFRQYQSSLVDENDMERNKRLVLDADALNLLSQDAELMSLLPAGSILTPHKQEFERLFGSSANPFERLDSLEQNCLKKDLYILLKGACSILASPGQAGKTLFHRVGHPAMAKGGSGDVLAGIIAAFLAQQSASAEDLEMAISAAVYCHGKVGEASAEKMGHLSPLARDLIEELPHIYRQLQTEAAVYE